MFTKLPNNSSQFKSNGTWIQKICEIAKTMHIFDESAQMLMPRYFLCWEPSVLDPRVGPPPLLRQNKCDKCGKTARRNKNLERHRQMCTAHLAPHKTAHSQNERPKNDKYNNTRNKQHALNCQQDVPQHKTAHSKKDAHKMTERTHFPITILADIAKLPWQQN